MLLQPSDKRKIWPAAATEGSWEEEKPPVLGGGKSLGQTFQKWFQGSSKSLLCSTKSTQGHLGRFCNSSSPLPNQLLLIFSHKSEIRGERAVKIRQAYTTGSWASRLEMQAISHIKRCDIRRKR